MVAAVPELGKLAHLRFRETSCFRAGMLHKNCPVWEQLLSVFHGQHDVDFLEIIQEGVLILLSYLNLLDKNIYVFFAQNSLRFR
jgi:hypothetical protein